jgi:hypothetical protein
VAQSIRAVCRTVTRKWGCTKCRGLHPAQCYNRLVCCLGTQTACRVCMFFCGNHQSFRPFAVSLKYSATPCLHIILTPVLPTVARKSHVRSLGRWGLPPRRGCTRWQYFRCFHVTRDSVVRSLADSVIVYHDSPFLMEENKIT